MELHPASFYVHELRPRIPPGLSEPAGSRLFWLPIHLTVIVLGTIAIAWHRLPWPLLPPISLLIGLSFAGLTDEAAYLRAPTTVARDWIRQNAQHLIESRMSRLLEAPVVIKIEASSHLPNGLKVGVRPVSSGAASAPQAKPAKPAGPQAPLQQTFENYCVGEANRAAVNAARAIAEGNGREVFSLVLLAGAAAGGTGSAWAAAFA